MTLASPQPYLFSDGSGALERFAGFPTRNTSRRNVDVWLPPAYASQPGSRFPVVYMHDGQNLFDPALAFGGVDWGIDEAVNRLVTAGILPGVIVVGIWNSPQRWRDYMPARPLTDPRAAVLRETFAYQNGGDPLSDGYLRFLVEELKPAIDQRYRTLPEREHTFVLGSSMGGLISLYALVEYPEVFGGAGCLSTHWLAGGDLLVEGLGNALPAAGHHKLYFDFGTATLDAGYEPFQDRMDRFMHAAGYRLGRDWLTRKFDGAEHSELAWRARVGLPLAFLLIR